MVLGRGEVKEKFCGALRPPALMSKGPRMVLVLNTHAAVRGGKFVARYKLRDNVNLEGTSSARKSGVSINYTIQVE